MRPPEFLRHILEALEASGIEYMVTGSMASMHYGEPRMTNDVDVVVDMRADQVPVLHQWFRDEDYHFDEEMAREAIRSRGQFNIIHPASGLKVDIILTRTVDFSRTEFCRRVRRELLPGRTACLARADDVILMKMVYCQEGGSDKHLRDIIGILLVSPEEVDREYVAEWAQHLGLADIWGHVLRRLEPA
jgi:hypothetical protein